MSQIEEDLQELSITMEEAKTAIDTHEALKRLKDNKDFNLIINENYFKLEAERVVGARAEPAMIMNEAGMQMLDNMIVSIGGLRQYFIKIQSQGNQAAMALASHRETETDLLREQMEASELQ